MLPVYTIELEQYGHVWSDPAPGGNDDGTIDPGETIAYTVELRNNGVGSAEGVEATLRVLNRNTMTPDPFVVADDDTASYETLGTGDRFTGTFGFTLDPMAVPADLLLELTIDHVWGTVAVQLSDLDPPASVDSLRALGSDVSITIKWAAAGTTDLLGYDILRSSTVGGPFERVNQQTVVGITFFEDFPLSSLTRFYYVVAPRDSSFNTGDRVGSHLGDHESAHPHRLADRDGAVDDVGSEGG